MAFNWRGNQLFTKQGQQKSTDDWTTFLMDMKESIEVNVMIIYYYTLVKYIPKNI
jgi:hypothetical protein